MSEKIGIKNLTEFLVFFAYILFGISATKDEKKVTWKSVFNFTAAGRAFLPAVQDYKEIAAELRDLDKAETEELKASFNQTLDLRSDTQEQIFEAVFAWALDGYKLVPLIRKGIEGKKFSQAKEEDSQADAE